MPGGGGSKLDLAKQAALQATTQLAPDDELGLWTFSTPAEGEANPIASWCRPGGSARCCRRSSRRSGRWSPDGGTALYTTTREAVRQVQDTFDRSRINAVVLLTDGKNEYPPDDNLDRLLSDVGGEDAETPVRVFPIAYGTAADLDILKRIAAASRAAAYDASDPASIANVLTAVLSNF